MADVVACHQQLSQLSFKDILYLTLSILMLDLILKGSLMGMKLWMVIAWLTAFSWTDSKCPKEICFAYETTSFEN